MRLSDWPDHPNTTPMSPSRIVRGKVQGNSICAADPSSASVMRTLLSSDSTSNIIHGLSPQPQEEETITSTCFLGMSADEKSIHCTTNQRNADLDAEVGSLLLGLDHPLFRHIDGDAFNNATLGTSILDDYWIGNLPS